MLLETAASGQPIQLPEPEVIRDAIVAADERARLLRRLLRLALRLRLHLTTANKLLPIDPGKSKGGSRG